MTSIISNYDELNFLERRKAFLDWRLLKSDPVIYWKKIKNEIAIACNGGKDKLYYCNSCDVATIKEGKVIDEDYYTGYNFDKSWNTRFIDPKEIVIEFDTPLEQSINMFYDTAMSLVKGKFHFIVFYAAGMRCPHIRIYDLLPDGLTLDEQYNARSLFVRKIVDWAYLQYLDYTLLNTGQTIQLEFSKHFKYGTMFKLLFEHVPERRLTADEIYYYMKEVPFHAN